ncbi:MAG: FAD-binding oxidoreductase [bacterium]|nr:FAD-binding oxidoreductase [bacterium]
MMHTTHTMRMDSLQDYVRKKEQAVHEFATTSAHRVSTATIAIGGKKTSNLFRDRKQGIVKKINLARLNRVISVDTVSRTAQVEGMTTYEELVEQTLPFGLMPTVVPELKSITIGGAVSGVGIEATSFRYGFVHETIKEMEILCGDGVVRTCSPDNTYADLFYGFPNSYGTLGYALKLTVSLIPIKRFVRVKHIPYQDATSFFTAIKAICEKTRNTDGLADFIDGVAFERGIYYLNIGTFTDTAPTNSDYTYMGIYYRSLAHREEDFLTAHDYIWRWDTDWFWCSKVFGVQNLVLRALVGPRFLRSTVYWKIKNLATRYKFTNLISRIKGNREPVIQDVEIPIERASEFMHFFHNEIGIKPIWICPTMPSEKNFDLFAVTPGQLYINFGFWDSVRSDKEEGYYNRLIEKKVQELGGKKSLYSSSYYPEDEFWTIYNKPAYTTLKTKYDPDGTFKNLFQKCVKRG